jgi:heme A synthase
MIRSIPSLTGFQKLGLVMVIGLLALVTLGGTVRVTDSGLACPDWPLCNGELISGGDYHVWIEWTHRLMASVIGFVILGFVVGAVRKHRDRRWVVVPALVGVVVLGVQVVLGGLTVTEDLDAGLVSGHLATAMVIVALLMTAWLATFVPVREAGQDERVSSVDRGEGRLVPFALLSGVGLFALLVLGAYMSGTNAGFFCSEDWPLCNGSLLPEGRLPSIHVAHRYLAAFVGLLLVGMWVMAWRRRRSATVVFRLATLVIVLFGVQVILGAVIMWTTLTEWSRVVHLVAGTLTWATMVVLGALLVRRSGWFPSLDQRLPLPDVFPRRFHLKETQLRD